MSYDWLRIIGSPFKFPRPIFYFGKIRVGTPYFLPRYWRKDRYKRAWWFKLDVVGLGYKTKYTEFNYRHEWDPVLSLVLFGMQFAVTFYLHTCIWESWLIYDRCTEGVVENRLRKCRKINPNAWVDGKGVKTDYFLKGLKKKWRIKLS